MKLSSIISIHPTIQPFFSKVHLFCSSLLEGYDSQTLNMLDLKSCKQYFGL